MYFFSLNFRTFVLANSVDLDEMLHYAAFHLGLHCLAKKIHLGVTSVQRFKHRRIRLDILVELSAKPCFLKTSRKISNILA